MRRILALSVLMAGAVISGCSDTDAIPEGDPSKTFQADLRGYKAGTGVMVGAQNTAYWVQQAATGFRPTTENDMPARVTLEEVAGGCAFERPQEGELVANVHIGRSTMNTPVYAFSRRDLAERTKKWIAAYQNLGEDANSPASAGGDMLRAVDVFVTETSRPVYLVLQNEWSNVVWNIHAAEGVRISNVAVLGSGSVAVANVDPSVPVQFRNAPALERCKVVPVRAPADYWTFVKRAEAGTSGDIRDKLEENRQMHRSYSRWFVDNFGQRSEDGVVGLQEVNQVLVGPVPRSPEQRVAFRPLKGAQVRIAREDHVLVSSKSEYRASHDRMVREIAEDMVGGDLKSLNRGS